MFGARVSGRMQVADWRSTGGWVRPGVGDEARPNGAATPPTQRPHRPGRPAWPCWPSTTRRRPWTRSAYLLRGDPRVGTILTAGNAAQAMALLPDRPGTPNPTRCCWTSPCPAGTAWTWPGCCPGCPGRRPWRSCPRTTTGRSRRTRSARWTTCSSRSGRPGWPRRSPGSAPPGTPPPSWTGGSAPAVARHRARRPARRAADPAGRQPAQGQE